MYCAMFIVRVNSFGATLAVGVIRDQSAPDSVRAGGVLTDMLATSLGRVENLRVVANSRLLE